MSNVIETFYKDNNIPEFLLKQKMAKFENNPDVAGEFEYWIKNKKYKQQETVVVEEYTAEKISQLSEYMDGEGAFMLLIELRENPDRAKKRIEEGFKYK